VFIIIFADPELTKITYWGRKIPIKFINYDVLLNDESFFLNLMDSMESRNAEIFNYKRFIKGIEQVISDINQELKRLE
jgi:hypothetical protein